MRRASSIADGSLCQFGVIGKMMDVWPAMTNPRLRSGTKAAPPVRSKVHSIKTHRSLHEHHTMASCIQNVRIPRPFLGLYSHAHPHRFFEEIWQSVESRVIQLLEGDVDQ